MMTGIMASEARAYFGRTKRRHAVDPAQAHKAFRRWLAGERVNDDPLDEGGETISVIKAALEACNATRTGFSFDLGEEQERESRAAMSAQLGDRGGYLRSAGVVGSFELALKYFSAVRQVASVVRTETGEPYHVGFIDDTANEGSIVPENAAPSSPADNTLPTLGLKVLADYKFTSGTIKAAQEFLEDDADGRAAALIGLALGERIGRAQNRAWTSGKNGFLGQATLGRTATSATAISRADLVALVGSVDPAYRMNGSFMMHADTLLAISQLVDGNGHLQFPEAQGRSPVLLGYPVVPNLHMDSALASGTKSVSFGSHDRIQVREVREVRVVMMQERFRDLDQVGLVAYHRADAALTVAAAVKYLVH